MARTYSTLLTIIILTMLLVILGKIYLDDDHFLHKTRMHHTSVSHTPIEGVERFSMVENIVGIGGKITPGAMPALRGLGFASVINLQQKDEPSAHIVEEGDAARVAGMNFVWIPTNKELPEEEAIEKFLQAVSLPTNMPPFIHCGSANRATAFWLVKRVLHDKWTVEKATKEAESLGLTSHALKDWAHKYIKGRTATSSHKNH